MRRLAEGLLATAAALVGVEVLSRGPFAMPAPAPAAALLASLACVLYATYRAGLAAGLATSALIGLYTIHFTSTAAFAEFTARTMQGAAIMTGIGAVLAIVVRALERKSSLAARALIEAERQHGRSLAASNLALREANETLEAFAFVVSHDLKEPVRAIQAYLRALDEDHGKALPHDGAELLQSARASTDRLESLMSGLLGLSRATRGEIELEAVDVKDVVDSAPCRASYERMLAERHGTLEVEEDGTPVLAARALLAQIVGNLVNNALRHNPKPAPVVRISSRATNGDVELVVEDDGPGFPRPLLDADDLATVPPSGRGGFGLLIARRGVERLGGKFSIGERVGGGGRVRIVLKAAPNGRRLAAAKEELA